MPLPTAKFPTSLAAASDMLIWGNGTPSINSPTLSSNIASGATSIVLTTGTGFQHPLDNYVCSIDDEIIFVTSRTTDTLNTCIRGFEGTTPAAHSSGALVESRVTAKAHNQVASEIAAIETWLGVNGANVQQAATVGAVAGQGGIWGVTNDYPQNVALGTLTSTVNLPKVVQWTLGDQLTIGHITWKVTTAGATGAKFDAGIYDINGNKLVTMGGVAATTTGVKTVAVTPVTLTSGSYIFAYCVSDATIQGPRSIISNQDCNDIMNQNGVKIGTGATPAPAGVLAATIGTITATVLSIPCVFFER